MLNYRQISLKEKLKTKYDLKKKKITKKVLFFFNNSKIIDVQFFCVELLRLLLYLLPILSLL